MFLRTCDNNNHLFPNSIKDKCDKENNFSICLSNFLLYVCSNDILMT